MKHTEDIARFEEEKHMILEKNNMLCVIYTIKPQNDIESMKDEIGRLEDENADLEKERKELKTQFKESKQIQEKMEKLNKETELIFFQKEATLETKMRELNKKYKEIKEEYKRNVKENKELIKTNKKYSDSLTQKNKEYTKLNDRNISTNFIENRKLMIESVKLKDKNEELTVKLNKLKKKLEETEAKLNAALTKAVSDPEIQMKRIISQNLATNSLSMRKASGVAEELGHFVPKQVVETNLGEEKLPIINRKTIPEKIQEQEYLKLEM